MDDVMTLWKHVVARPADGFVDLCAPLATTPIAEQLVLVLAQHATAARIEPFTLTGLRTEHEDGETVARATDALVVELSWHGARRSRWIFGHPQPARGASATEFPFDRYGFVRVGETTVYGADDLSVWGRDSYKFETARRFPLALLEGEQGCALEIGDDQWLVRGANSATVLATSITTSDRYVRRVRGPREADYHVLKIPARSLAEQLLRVGLVRLYGGSEALVLRDDRAINYLLPEGGTPALDARELLEVEVPAVIAAQPDEFKKLDVIQLDVADVGSWTIDAPGGRVTAGSANGKAERIAVTASELLDAYIGVHGLDLFYAIADRETGTSRNGMIMRLCKLFS